MSIRATRDRPKEPDPDSERRERDRSTPAADRDRIVSGYLRDVSATPLLERELEASHAADLHEARTRFAALVLELPDAHRAHVLNGDSDGPQLGAKWRLRHLDSCLARMETHLAPRADRRLSRLLRDARRLKRRIDSARDALVLANLRFVAHLARQMSNDRATYLELIQEGNLGLIEAVERFEYKRGHRFSTYAYWWIRKSLHLAISGQARMIYIPSHVRERVSAMNRVNAEFVDRLGRTATIDELADRLRLPPAKVQRLQALTREPLPLETLGDEKSRPDPIDFLSDVRGVDPLKSALDRELHRTIQASLELLNPQQRKIIRMRFGIGYKRRRTLREIGEELSLSRERVRQLERRALEDLRESPQARSLVFGRKRRG